MLKSFLVLLVLCAVAFAALPTYSSASCQVTFNNYPTEQCSGDTPDGPSDTTTGMMMKRGPLQNITYSCNMQDDTSSNGYGEISVQFTAGGNTVQASLCNTWQCKYTSSRTDVTSWLNGLLVGTTTNCTYQADTPTNVYLKLNNICSDRGTYSATSNACSCNDGYEGDSCSQAINNGSSNEQTSTSSASALFISCFLAVAALFALVM